MAWGALRAIARREWIRHWRGIVLLGVLAGLAGGCLVTGAAVLRRTATASDRLVAAVAPGDLRLQVFGEGVAEDVPGLPGVERAVVGGIAVARVEGRGFVYLGTFLPQGGGELLRPVVIDGRVATGPDEVVVIEDVADALEVEVGDSLHLAYLEPEEVAQFDVGFGDPDGPEVEVRIAGIGRVPSGVMAGTPVVASTALAERLEEAVAGRDVYVDLADEAGVRPAFEQALDDLAADAERPPGAEELPPVAVIDPLEGTRDAARSTGVLVAGLGVAVVVASLSSLVVAWQSLMRHHARTAADQEVESALGLTSAERSAARVLPLVPAALLAIVVAATVAALGAGLDPPGAVRRMEPSPGWRLDLPLVAGGAVLVGVVVLALGERTARRAGRRRSGSGAVASSRARRLAPRRGGWTLLGATFALSRAGAGSRVTAGASVAGAMVAVAGLVASLVVGASLGRLLDEPARWGWGADVAVVDVTDAVLADLSADPRVGGVTELTSAALAVGGTEVQGYGLGELRGAPSWTMVEGRLPRGTDEIVLGLHVAAAEDASVGDDLPVGDRVLRVVGIGVGPPLGGEQLGRSVLVDGPAMELLAEVQLFREALVVAAPGEDAGALAAALAERYEISVREQPRAVRDLADLDVLPPALAGFLVAVGVAALTHGVWVGAQTRRVDLAVVRVLGAERRHVRLVVVAMAGATAVIAVVVGAPLGWAVGRLAWGEAARGAGVEADVALPASVVVAIVLTLVVAPLLAYPPGRRAGDAAPRDVLREG
ncbi:ABC transporter permease [Actinomarinicola tropica]|uniref:FtsX-like permease family protein n=1 Tax=Actinomarinicola tropica TaxID=2789776 RepID=A0A5Q2RQX0_9ACTN|nr:ABC transporter permease [Actinomarinicola tropica]QGG96826.1 FtsX-like permease family protein [Actinomarinicola tropica]